MSPRLTPFDAHLPIYLTLTEPPPNPYPVLTKAASYLCSYLRSRAVRMPSPLWFGSAVHLSMMANMPFALGGPALQELIGTQLVSVQWGEPDPPLSVSTAEMRPHGLRPSEPLAGSGEEGGGQ